jgi:RecA/RadA recombinase
MKERLSSGCEGLDLLLGGGFEPGIITQIYGEAGTGKTNIILQLAVGAVSRGFKVIFIDTEGFSVEGDRSQDRRLRAPEPGAAARIDKRRHQDHE